MRDDRSEEELRSSAARRFLAGVTEHAFMTELGVADPALVDYITDLITRFLRSDTLYGVRTPKGEQLTAVADLLAEAAARRGPAKRSLHRHIGDYTLFLTGLFPQLAEQLRRGGSPDALIDYRTMGKESYAMASQIPVERAYAPDDLLERLSEEFELCVYGLGEVRKAWNDDPGGSLLL